MATPRRTSGRISRSISGLMILGVTLVSLSCIFDVTPGPTAAPGQNTSAGQQISGDNIEATVRAAVAATLVAASGVQPASVETPVVAPNSVGPQAQVPQLLEIPTPASEQTSPTSPGPTSVLQPSAALSLAAGCSPVADRTVVTAWIDQAQVGIDLVEGGGFILFVEQTDEASFAGKRVSFMVGVLVAEESAIWETGGADELDLTAKSQGLPSPTPLPAGMDLRPDSAPGSGAVAQPLPPHVFIGTAKICG